MQNTQKNLPTPKSEVLTKDRVTGSHFYRKNLTPKNTKFTGIATQKPENVR